MLRCYQHASSNDVVFSSFEYDTSDSKQLLRGCPRAEVSEPLLRDNASGTELMAVGGPTAPHTDICEHTTRLDELPFHSRGHVDMAVAVAFSDYGRTGRLNGGGWRCGVKWWRMQRVGT